MKFRKNKKGFTIVELIIVIAVIGVLTAVMVPTIVHLVGKANEASDKSLVSNLNKAIQMRYAETSKKPATMHETVEGLEEYGYKIDALVAKSDQSLLYDLDANEFLREGDASEARASHYWKIQDRVEQGQKYNIYASKNFEFAATDVLSVGFDAGASQNLPLVKFATERQYETNEYTVIRTNSAYTTLNIDAAKANVKHYGNASAINVTAIANNSYSEFGSVAALNVKAGHVNVESDAFVGKISVDSAATTETVTVDTNGSVFSTSVIEYDEENMQHEEVANPTEEQKQVVETVETVTSEDIIKIGTADALINLASTQSQGIISGSLKVELTSNINLSGRTWVPFGADLSKDNYIPFNGSIDGKNHSIIGLSNGSYKGIQIANGTTGQIGEHYGFISNSGVVTVSNLKFEAVDIDSETATICAAVVAHAKGGSVTLSNVSVEGKVTGKDKVASLIGYAKDAVEVEISNCVVKANLTAHEYRIGGLFGFSSGATITISDSSYTGKIIAEGTDKNGNKYIAAIGSIHATGGGVMNLSVSNFTLGEGSVVQQAVGVGAAYTQNDVVMFAKMNGTISAKTGIDTNNVITAAEYSVSLTSQPK